MRFSLAAIVLPTLALAAPQTADKPVAFYAQLFQESATCASGGKTSAYVDSRGPCVNIAVPGTGSALIRVGEATKYYLAGWTERDCKGTAVLVETNVGVCTDLGRVDVKSWSNDLRPFGEQ